MNKIWFTSDSHYDHTNIIEYCDRPFVNTDAMNKALINNWNSVVKKGHTVFHLGDFAICGKDKIIEVGKQLNGEKILILGNHDNASVDTYREAGFKLVYKHPVILQDFFILSHKPPEFMSENTPYAFIYGHVHDSEMYQTITARSACVCVERWNYTPVDFDVLKKGMMQYEEKE